MDYTNEDKNFGMSSLEFSNLADALIGGDETLFEKVFLNHAKSCIAYLKTNYKMPEDEAYDSFLDGLLQFRKLIIQGKIQYGNLRFLLTRMSSQVWMKSKRGIQPESMEDRDIPSLPDSMYEFEDVELDALEKAWAFLGEQCVKILTAFYYHDIPLKIFAQNNGLQEDTTRKQKQRCMEKLRESFLKNFSK